MPRFSGNAYLSGAMRLRPLAGRRSARKLLLPGRIAPAIAGIWDWFAATDPGLLRLFLATRGMLSVGLTATVLFYVADLLHQPLTLFGAGVTLSLMGPFIMRDPTARQRQRTLLLLLIPASAAAIATSLLHDKPPEGEAFFLTLVFVGVLLQARDPRAIGLALAAIVMSYIGLYLRLPPATLPLQLLSLAVSVTVVWLVCFRLLPARPANTLRRAVRAVQRRAARVLRETRENPTITGQSLHRHLTRLNEAALAAEDQLEVIDEASRTALRQQLFALEQAVSQLMQAAGTAPLPERLRTRLTLAEARLRHGRTRTTPGGGSQASADTAQHALMALYQAASALDRAAARAVSSPAHEPLPPPVVRGALAWRTALQVTLASVIAMAGGMLLSPQRWFWAVVAVYIVFLNVRSRGEAIHRGLHRVVGTLAGLFGGLLLAALTTNSVLTGCAVMLLAVFGIYYFYAVSYGVAILCVTILLGMLYGLLGSPLEPLLMLRLEETAIGVFAAMLTAIFVLPVPTRRQVSLSGRAVLTELQAVVRLSRQALTGQASLAPIEAVRRLDRQIVDLRRSLTPLTAGRFVLRRGNSARPVTALLACAQWARTLAAASRVPAGADAALIACQADVIDARIAAMLADGPAPPPCPAANAGGSTAVTALRNLDLALQTLSERLQASVLEAFAID